MPSGWRTGKEVKLSPRLPRREVLIIAAGAVIAVIVTLLILGGSSRARERRTAEQAMEAQGRQAPAAREELALEDFLLPVSRPAQNLPEYYPFRPRMQKWSRELVDRFWVSPRQVAVGVIGVVNDRNMEEFFKVVP